MSNDMISLFTLTILCSYNLARQKSIRDKVAKMLYSFSKMASRDHRTVVSAETSWHNFTLHVSSRDSIVYVRPSPSPLNHMCDKYGSERVPTTNA